MDFGYNMFPIVDMAAREIVEIARKTEEYGYESLWMPDHFVFPPRITPMYPFSADGQSPWRPDHHLFEPWVLLSHLAAVTTRLKLGVHVFLLPLRDTLNTARAVTTLDLFSEGRAVFAAGLGWLKDEYDIGGRDWSTRGATMTEQILALKALWTEPVAEFRGKHVVIPPCVFEPKPHQKPHPPILVGGTNEAALRRAALHADGWTGVNHDLEETRGIIARLTALRREAGRESLPFEISVMAINPTVDTVRRYGDLGVGRLLVFPPTESRSPTAQEFIDGLRRFSEEIIFKV